MKIDNKVQFNKIKKSLDTVNSRIGEFTIYKNDAIISQAIRLFGEYCHAEIDVMATYLNENSLYIDIGTNIGYHALGVHRATNCQVLGFEPNPKHFAVAVHNCRNTLVGKIELMNAAVSNTKSTFIMKDFDETVESNYGDIHHTSEGIETEAVVLDDILLVHPQFIKIDVEGHELEVLHGSVKTISKARPIIMYEALEYDVWTECYKFLDSKNYKQYWVACRTKPIAETFIKTNENPFGNGAVANVLAVPKEKEQPKYLMPVTAEEPYPVCLEKFNAIKILF